MRQHLLQPLCLQIEQLYQWEVCDPSVDVSTASSLLGVRHFRSGRSGLRPRIATTSSSKFCQYLSQFLYAYYKLE
jgi:hypothetical protein